MKKILALALFAVALVSCRQTMQTDGFKLSGHLEGLQVGDTLFLKTFLLPDWKEDGTDTILVEKEGIFSAFIPMEHTTFYLLTHQPIVQLVYAVLACCYAVIAGNLTILCFPKVKALFVCFFFPMLHPLLGIIHIRTDTLIERGNQIPCFLSYFFFCFAGSIDFLQIRL